LLILLILSLVAFAITSRVAKRFTNILALIIAVIVAVLICYLLGSAYLLEFTQAGSLDRESAIRMIYGTGFWLYLFGAICGAWYRPNFVMGKCKHCDAKISWLYSECDDCA
jgi:biotin transporter BioY